MPTAADVKRAVEASFPVERHAAVLKLLRSGYTQRNERCRVQLAVLVLADGNLTELRGLVKAANDDYRDLLYWAEYPEESGSGTKKEMRARYRKLGVPVPDDLK
jgi:hypothetical protein